MEVLSQLRFKEFTAGWKIVTINQLIDDGLLIPPMDGNHGEIHPKSSDYVPQGIPFIMANDVIDGSIDFENCKKIPLELAKSLRKGFSIPDDVLLTHKGSVGNTAIVPDHSDFEFVMLTPQVTYYRVAEPNALSNRYILQYFNSGTFQKFLKIAADSGTRPYIGITQQRKSPFQLCEFDEQKKIAEFLGAVDEKIRLLQSRHEQLTLYKKGVMQKIFAQDIRFKADDGSDFPDWETVKMKEVFYEVKDKVGNKNIETYSISSKTGFRSQKEKFGKDISGEQNKNYIVLQTNQFSYNKGNSKTFKYGCVYLSKFDFPIAVPNVFISFALKDEKNVEEFFSQKFADHHLDWGLRRIISSSARMNGLLNLSKVDFFDLTVPLAHPDEQQKIADFLSAIDDKIDAVSAQIENMQSFKKGLLQQMFV